MVRVLVFHLGFYFSGGGEKLVIEEIKGLQKAGFEVDCFAPIVDKKRCFPGVIKKYPIYPLLPQLPSWFPKKFTIQLLLTCAFFPFICFRFRKYNIVFAANQPGPYFGFWLKKLFRIPYIAYLAQPLRLLHPRKVDKESGLFIRERLEFLPYLVKVFSWFIDWADRAGVGSAELVFVNGEYAKKMIENTYGVKTEVNAAGSYPKSYLPSFKKRYSGTVKANGFNIGKPYILLTNRHFPQKRFEYAIISLPSVLGQTKDIKLVITGEPMDYTQSLKDMVSRLGIKKNVVFTGLVGDNALEKLYENALVYVYTAPEEDFGMGIIEAMANGTPAVAWDNAGPSYIMKGDVGGFLARPFRVDSFADDITKLTINQKLAENKSNEGWQHIKRDYSYKLHNGKIEKAIRGLLKKQKPGKRS